ncbi:hypothetical protein G5V59_02730 [Nocardioides sp. W3-2-3]|uniref:recombination directionality factor n=1 Tax=Nocardioides convexus TaxID=2712224 RepID=UPI002418A696|nr:hypothetical protein [Nocardioides convexus]NGZ99666.1 hypothetical protein [Nocardioides convexus]
MPTPNDDQIEQQTRCCLRPDQRGRLPLPRNDLRAGRCQRHRVDGRRLRRPADGGLIMPIITTQRRMAEHGRIRLGQKVTGVSKAGREYTRPAKLDRFRFTSASQRQIEEIATTYGGEARAWDNDGKGEYEVITDATAIPVIVVKGGFSQWHEHWTRAGLQHRCDGEKDVAGIFCDPQDPDHVAAIEKPTTRLSVMLSEIESLGVWRMETKGWNAAAEPPLDGRVSPCTSVTSCPRPSGSRSGPRSSRPTRARRPPGSWSRSSTST